MYVSFCIGVYSQEQVSDQEATEPRSSPSREHTFDHESILLSYWVEHGCDVWKCSSCAETLRQTPDTKEAGAVEGGHSCLHGSSVPPLWGEGEHVPF